MGTPGPQEELARNQGSVSDLGSGFQERWFDCHSLNSGHSWPVQSSPAMAAGLLLS